MADHLIHISLHYNGLQAKPPALSTVLLTQVLMWLLHSLFASYQKNKILKIQYYSTYKKLIPMNNCAPRSKMVYED